MSAEMLDVVRADFDRAVARWDVEAIQHLQRLFTYLLARCEREGYLS